MFATALTLLATAAALAANPPANPAPPAPPPAAVDCHDAAHRAIDFWIGEWIVSDTRSSSVVANSRIDWIVGGCAIRETYDQSIGPGGKPLDYHGTSITALAGNNGIWKQFYVDTAGVASTLEGTLRDSTLDLRAATPSAINRMTVEKQADGRVRQRGSRSGDGGKTWSATYDFTYARKE